MSFCSPRLIPNLPAILLGKHLARRIATHSAGKACECSRFAAPELAPDTSARPSLFTLSWAWPSVRHGVETCPPRTAPPTFAKAWPDPARKPTCFTSGN
jgi:hypothetical protein